MVFRLSLEKFNGLSYLLGNVNSIFIKLQFLQNNGEQ
jgi:hypothetical protein